MSFQFVHYNTTDQSIIEPLSKIKITNQTGPVTDPNTLWIATSDSTLRRGPVNIERLAVAASSATFTNGTIALTPTGATTAGTFTLEYSTNGKIVVATIVQAAPVAQGAIASTLGFSGSLPLAIRPRIAVKNTIFVVNGLTETLGYIKISTAGVIEIGVGPSAPFTGLLGSIYVYPTITEYLI